MTAGRAYAVITAQCHDMRVKTGLLCSRCICTGMILQHNLEWGWGTASHAFASFSLLSFPLPSSLLSYRLFHPAVPPGLHCSRSTGILRPYCAGSGATWVFFTGGAPGDGGVAPSGPGSGLVVSYLLFLLSISCFCSGVSAFSFSLRTFCCR